MKKTILCSHFLLLFCSTFSQNLSPKKITEKEPHKQNYFGDSGDIDGDYAVACGIHSENPIAYNGGIANVYKINEAGKWIFTRTMYPTISNSDDRFGQNACAMSKDHVIVGAWMNVDQKCGAAHIFKFWADSSWKEVAYLAPKDTAGVRSFGGSVDIYGSYAIVGSTGSAYIFELQTNGGWKQIKKLKAPSGIIAEGFGNNVAIFKDYIVVTAEWEDINGVENAGAVYVYNKDEKEDWKYVQKIVLNKDEVKKEAEFGTSIAIYENNILIGYPKCDMGEIPNSGMVYLYENTDGKFELKQKLYTQDFGFNIYRFGEKVSLSDNFIAISQAQNRAHKGSVYLFEKEGNEYKEVNSILSPIDSYYGNDFGQNALALNNNRLLVGGPGDGFCEEKLSSCGAAYFYSLPKTLPKKTRLAYIPRGMTQAIMAKKMKQHDADSIIFDHINQDDVYILKGKKTGLWGMYQAGQELIPMQYEHINFSGWNDPFTFVKKNEKWCIYYGIFDDDEHLVHCGYDELKKFEHKDYLYVAGKKDGKWHWVNWYNGSITNSNKDYHQELVIFSNWNPGNYNHFDLKR